MLRNVISGGKGLLERILHPVRRRTAESKLRSLEGLRRILVLCMGNVCRSPYGERSLRQRSAAISLGQVTVESAGLLAIGDRPPPIALEVARQRGIELEGHASTVLTREKAREAELILVMDVRQADLVERFYGAPRRKIILLGDLDPSPIARRGILDPLNGSTDTFVASYDRIDRCLERMIQLLATSTPGVAGSGGTRVALSEGEPGRRSTSHF